tara:strand:- start:6 stop:1286 length:1281 start_codon:yes stop_codon:yes gene_type:complete
MSDLINLDFMKLQDGKVDKTTKNKNISLSTNNNENFNKEEKFILENVIGKSLEDGNLEMEKKINHLDKINSDIQDEKLLLNNFIVSDVNLEKNNKKDFLVGAEETSGRDNKLNQETIKKLSKKDLKNKKSISVDISSKKNNEDETFLKEERTEMISKDATIKGEKNLSNIFSSIKNENKKKFSTFFKNYLNFSNQKKFKNKFKMLKVVASNQLSLVDKKYNNISENSIIIQPSEKIKKNEKEIIYEKNVALQTKKNDLNFHAKETINKEETSEVKNLNNENLNNFDRLKNILDIRNNNVSGRMAEIFERNLKLNNKKFEIQLKPENLGKIEINIELQGDNIEINMRADNNHALQILSEGTNSLQKMLQSQGLNLSNFNLNNNNNKNKESTTKKNNNVSKNVDEIDQENNIKKDKAFNSRNLVYIKA